MEQRAIRDAATVILVRDPETRPKILMGRRGKGAAFMPDKFVFPGGAVDSYDHSVPFAGQLPLPCATRLEERSAHGLGPALFAAAVRELWEEAGLMIGTGGEWPGVIPKVWSEFAEAELLPAPCGLSFVFRAITPPGGTRRFDARFFLGCADIVAGDPDDFTRASDELSDLRWISVSDLNDYDMPFITKVVLDEIVSTLPRIGPPPSVPYIRNDDTRTAYLRLGGDDP